MIPRNLPKLVTDALTNRWDARLEHGYGPSFAAIFERGDDTVRLEWWWKGDRLAIAIADVNTYPTPYRQCVALLRSKEN